MYGLGVLCASKGNLWYHKSFKRGWGLQEGKVDSLLLGGIIYTLWCSYADMYSKDVDIEHIVLHFPKKETRLYLAKYDTNVWMVSMHASISTEFAKHIVIKAKESWDSIKNSSNILENSTYNAVGLHWAKDELRKRNDMNTLKHGFLEYIKTDVQLQLRKKCESIGGLQCLVVWDKSMPNFSFETFQKKKNTMRKLLPCLPCEEKPHTTRLLNYSCKFYIDLRESPEANFPWQFQSLILKHVIPGLDLEQMKNSSKNKGYLYNLLTDVRGKTKNKFTYDCIWTIMLGDLLIFIAVKESKDINSFVSQHWIEINEMGTLLEFSMIRASN